MNKFFIIVAALMATANLNVKALPTGNDGSSSELLKDTSRVVDLDEVIIVSQPKENARLRRQPVASTVFTTNELRSINANDLSGLSLYVPSFVVPSYGSRYTSSMYVRGIGSRSGDPSVGLYYDDVPLVSKATYNRHYYQLDRIDVLRGPQGSLYGINSEAGLVRMYSKNPMNYQGTDIHLGIGTGLYSNAEIAKFHRPSDKFAFSVAGFYSGLGGFFDNANLSEKADLTNEAGGRMRFIWTPTRKFTFDLTTDYQYTNQNAFAYGEYNNETGDWNDPSTTTMNGYRRQLVTTGLRISYTFDRLLLSSTTSHQYLNDLMLMDQDYLPQDFMQLEQRQRMNALTEEISLKSRGDGYWKHVSGLFLSKQWLHTTAPVNFGDDMNRMIVKNMGMPSFIADMITLSDNAVPGDFKTPQLNLGVYHESNFTLVDRLVFTLGLRYDYQRVSIDYDSNARFLLAFKGTIQGAPMDTKHYYRSAFVGSAKEDYHQLLPKFALTYNFDDGNNVYATVSKGFRAGGYNLQMFSDIFKTEQSSLGQQLMALMKNDYEVRHNDQDYANVNNTITYKPETSWNYEAGTHLNLFVNTLHADLSVFYMQIRDQQLSVMAGNYGYGRMMINAGRTASYGAELALRGSLAADHLTWAASYGFTHSTFRDYTDSVMISSGEGRKKEERNYRGNRVPFVPRHTFSVLADYRFDLPGDCVLHSITLGANVAGNGDTYWDTDNLYRQKLYAVVGAHVLLDFGKVGVNLWGRNLTNTHYNTFLVNSSVDGTDRSFSQRGNPIQVGLDVSLHL